LVTHVVTSICARLAFGCASPGNCRLAFGRASPGNYLLSTVYFFP
jgi:hypothetical protein